jgi:hypothetical protein
MNKKWRDAFWGILLLLAIFASCFWLAVNLVELLNFFLDSGHMPC